MVSYFKIFVCSKLQSEQPVTMAKFEVDNSRKYTSKVSEFLKNAS
jgi:hypothetical protein